jgi:nucleotide-binding universal stress UspA family protein
MKNIAVFFDATPAGRRVLESAARLAGEQEARLIGICVAPSNAGMPENGFVRGDSIHKMLKALEPRQAAQLQDAGEALWLMGTRYSVSTEFRVISPIVADRSKALLALYCDLVVLANPLVGLPGDWNFQHLLAQIGLPLLVIPDAWQGSTIGWKIALVWNSGRFARRTVADALPLLTTAQTIDVLITDPEAISRQPEGGTVSDMTEYLRGHGVHVDSFRLGRSPDELADSVLEHAVGTNTDLIVYAACDYPGQHDSRDAAVVGKILETEYLPLFVSR